MTALFVDVLGDPAPQGSKSYKGRTRAGKPILVESSKAVKPWRAAVADAAEDAARLQGWPCADGPVSVEVDFYLPRPVRMPRGRFRPSVRPDLDKLLRSTLDALKTSGAIADDAVVVSILASKHYAGVVFAATGARITIRTIEGSAR